MEKYPTTATAARMRSRKSVWTAPATGSNRRMDASESVSMATSGTGHLTLACLARILSQPKPKQQRLERSVCLRQYADIGAESLIEHSYLCASCTFGQAIFNLIVGDDGIRPAALQN